MIAIGVDIGGTQVKAGLLVDSTQIRGERVWPTPVAEDPAVLAKQIRDLCADLGCLDRAADPPDSLSGDPFHLGVACAGLIDGDAGRICISPNLPNWADVPLAEILERELLVRPVVLNDANAFVLAETRLGAARGKARDVIGLTLGTGVGGGLVLDGSLRLGRNGFAGEPGHMTIEIDGPLCACGNRGCLEALIGTRAILDRYRSSRSVGDPPAARKAEGVDGELTPKKIADLANSGDPAAQATFRETGRILGVALAGLTHLLDPELFIVGGGISLAGELLLEPARAALNGSVMYSSEKVPDILAASLGNSAGWIGAALAAVDGPPERLASR